MTEKLARCPYRIVDDKFCAMNVRSPGRLICKKCGYVVFPDGTVFGCACSKYLAVSFSPQVRRSQRSVVVKRTSRFDLMPARNLRIVKRELGLMRGICEACNKQFRSHIHTPAQAEWEIKILFERHTCKMLAERLGIMRGSREG
jgi:hypothetical protein